MQPPTVYDGFTTTGYDADDFSTAGIVLHIHSVNFTHL